MASQMLKGNPSERRVACVLLGFCESLQEQTQNQVSDLRRDGELEVARAAQGAMKRLLQSKRIGELLENFANADRLQDRWLWLDLVCSFGDVGDSRYPASWTIALKGLTPMQGSFANSKIKDRREKELKELKKVDERKNR